MDDIFSFIEKYDPNLAETRLDRLVLIDSSTESSMAINENAKHTQSHINESPPIESSQMENAISDDNKLSRQKESDIKKEAEIFFYNEDMEDEYEMDDFCSTEAFPLAYSQSGTDGVIQNFQRTEEKHFQSEKSEKDIGVWNLEYAFKCLYKNNKSKMREYEVGSSIHQKTEDVEDETIPKNTITLPETSLDGIELEQTTELGRKLQLVIGLLIKEENHNEVLQVPEVIDKVPRHFLNRHSYNPNLYKKVIESEKEKKIQNPREYDIQPKHTFEERLKGWSVEMCGRKSSNIRDTYFLSPLVSQRLRSFKEVISYIMYEKLPGASSKKKTSE